MASIQSDVETVELAEYDESRALEVPDAIVETIDTRINASATRLGYEYTPDAQVRFTSSSYVGLVSLPKGLQVRIRPKAAGGNFLWMLLYAHGAAVETIDSTVQALDGEVFLDAIGSLFLDRLQQVIRQGLGKAYRTTQEREGYLRGRLDLQRQVARGGVTATKFEIEYEELTHDTLANQTVLYATHLLTQLVSESSLQSALRQREQQLRREVTLRPVHRDELEAIYLDRLTEYYEDVLRLARIVIRSTFVDNLQAGTQETYGLLVNMNRVFERVIERAAEDALSTSPWTVEAQSQVHGLVTGGSPTVNMYPDIVVRDEHGDVRLVGDAKWKTGSPSQSDIYQMTSYQLADDVPGVLLYPAQDDSIETEYEIDDRLALHVRELPTDQQAGDFEGFTDELAGAVAAEFDALTPIP